MDRVDNDGIGIAFEASGEGVPVVLLHGFTANAASWREFGYVDPLVERGYRVIAVDTRGHGASGAPHDSALYGQRARAGDVVAVLDALNIPRAHVIGYSMGGWIAYGVAAHFPHRLLSLTAIGVHPFAQDMSFFRQALDGGLEGWLATVEAVAGPMPGHLRETILSNDLAAMRAAVADDRADTAERVVLAGCPMAFLCGDRDRNHDPVARFADIVDGPLTSLPGLDHFASWLEAGTTLPPLMDALDRASRLSCAA